MLDNEMKPFTQPTVVAKAKQLIKNGGLTQFEENGNTCTSTVVDEYNKNQARVVMENGRIVTAACTCRFSYEDSSTLCPHAAALALYALSPARLEKKRREALLDQGAALLEKVGVHPARQQCLRLEVTLHVQRSGSCASIRAGISRMYVIRNIGEFVQAYFAGDLIELSKNSLIDPQVHAFNRRDERVLTLLGEASRYVEGTAEKKTVPLSEYQLRRILRAVSSGAFLVNIGNARTVEMFGVNNVVPEMKFRLYRDEAGDFQLDGAFEAPVLRLTRDAEFVFCNDVLYHIPRNVRSAFAAVIGHGRTVHWHFADRQAGAVVSDLLPELRAFARVEVQQEIQDEIITAPLSARVDLDVAGHGISAFIRFAYGDITVTPTTGAISQHAGILCRDHGAERRITDILADYGFVTEQGAMLLMDTDGIYRFLDRGLAQLNECAHVFASEALLHIRPRVMPVRGQMRVGGRGIEFSLMLQDIAADKTPEILQALREKKKYVRLTDGSFITLGAKEHWDDLAREIIDNGVMCQDHYELEAYRTVYLNSLLDAAGLEVERDGVDASVRLFEDVSMDVPSPIPGLRNYQLRGFNWMRQLYQMSLGGVLADDMGLGKTVQTLSVIKYAKMLDGFMTSLVIAPTSLIYNWEKEIRKFAPDLSVMVLEGSGDMRALQIEKAQSYDVLIASYAQIRRDVSKLAQYQYRFCVLDEAQNIKNYQSVGAVAVKRFKAKARFALTGTPMENHIGELWSVFDFVLPGYLGSHSAFIARFGDGGQAEELSIKIRPFLMRRIKKDVLEELPDKIEDRVLVEMNDYQQRVYRAMLARYKAEIVAPAMGDSFNQNRMKVLAAITRLRQLCCHPSLFLEGYQGGSGKLDALMEIVQQCARENRKMLVFSQFTAMLGIIRQALEELGVSCMYLDGDVPARMRTSMCEQFNTDETTVFLISTKAGGTGLNLTGADTVVHFDPWWNPAVEDQATDRAHRIGQTKKVHVVRLITRNTIEEKVADLQTHKRELIDAVVRTGEILPAGMGQEEILALFD